MSKITAPAFGLSFGCLNNLRFYFYARTQKDGTVCYCKRCGERFKKGDIACNGDFVKYIPRREKK